MLKFHTSRPVFGSQGLGLVYNVANKLGLHESTVQKMVDGSMRHEQVIYVILATQTHGGKPIPRRWGVSSANLLVPPEVRPRKTRKKPQNVECEECRNFFDPCAMRKIRGGKYVCKTCKPRKLPPCSSTTAHECKKCSQKFYRNKTVKPQTRPQHSSSVCGGFCIGGKGCQGCEKF